MLKGPIPERKLPKEIVISGMQPDSLLLFLCDWSVGRFTKNYPNLVDKRVDFKFLRATGLYYVPNIRKHR